MVKPGKPKLLKLNNRIAVLELFRKSGVLAAADIADRLKISKTTIMKILDYLLDTRIIDSVGKGHSTSEGGKRPELFKFNENFGYAMGHHLLPEELLSVVTDLDGTVLHRISTAIKKNEKLNTVIKKIAKAVKVLSNEPYIDAERIIGIGIGIPGITNLIDGVVRCSPWFESWGGEVNFVEQLKAELDINVPIFIDNESRFQVFAEKQVGVAKDKRNILAVSGGEGLAAGIVVKDEIKRGVHDLAGEIGHMIINPTDEVACVCGSRGCFEAQVYESRLIIDAKQGFADHSDSLIFQKLESREITSEKIFESANQGDRFAQQLMDNIIRWYAIAFSNVIMIVDPDLIVIQGIYAKAGDYFIENLRQMVNKLVLIRIKKDVEIKYSNLGKRACVLGAALFVISEYFKQDFKSKNRTALLTKVLS